MLELDWKLVIFSEPSAILFFVNKNILHCLSQLKISSSHWVFHTHTLSLSLHFYIHFIEPPNHTRLTMKKNYSDKKKCGLDQQRAEQIVILPTDKSTYGFYSMTWKQNHEHEHCRIDKWRECSTYIRIMNRIKEKYNKWNGTVQQLQLLIRTFNF